ncbi:uncharacterized protein [Henckelia pumila]|uniref:uncharacterized protein n=1 Tax=Henckelia pumila TaxID=405737 RepID=UPI003C6E652E
MKLGNCYCITCFVFRDSEAFEVVAPDKWKEGARSKVLATRRSCSPRKTVSRQLFITSDGGTIALDWVTNLEGSMDIVEKDVQMGRKRSQDEFEKNDEETEIIILLVNFFIGIVGTWQLALSKIYYQRSINE